MKLKELFDQVCNAFKDITDEAINRLNDPDVSDDEKTEILKLLKRLNIKKD